MKRLLKIIVLIQIFSICCAGFCIGGQQALSEQDKEFLVNLSRQTLYCYLKDHTVPAPDKSKLSTALEQKQTCFVTLNKKGVGLRGCMGFEDKGALYENVIDRTIAAATKDPRFKPVKYEELRDIKLEISVLSQAKPLDFGSPEDLLSKLRPGTDGVILRTRYGESTYLPQVWDHFQKKEDFLSHLCMKHGAPMDTWRKDYKNIRVETYQATVFGEEIYGRRVIGLKGGTVGKKGAFVIGAVSPLQNKLVYGGGHLKEGTKLAPGAIVTVDSDVTEP